MAALPVRLPYLYDTAGTWVAKRRNPRPGGGKIPNNRTDQVKLGRFLVTCGTNGERRKGGLIWATFQVGLLISL